MCLPKIHVKILLPSVMILGGGAVGKWLGHEDAALMNGISTLIQETLESILTPLHHVRTQQEDSCL